MYNKYSLVGINTKYVHSNLAIRYIKKYCDKKNIIISNIEYSINDNIDKILKGIRKEKSNVLGFSCYIWNIELILKICNSLKKILPSSTIILGGPEVSYDSEKIMRENPSIDFIVCEEGEKTFYKLIKYLEDKTIDIQSIEGLSYRLGDEIKSNKKREPIRNLDIIPFPYRNLKELKNKIIYYETSRGCPFECQYCLSSIEKGVRYFSLERVYEDIDFFIDNNVKQVKLVDRTFNCHQERCIRIMDYIIKKGGNTNFHLEISSKLISSEFLSLVEKAPRRLFQFEIGIQTTNPHTLKAIKRKEPFEDIKENISKLLDLNVGHIHLDLIAGLPYEDLDSFKNSFDQAYSLQPDMLQLGFLKLLKGSGLRKKAAKYGIRYHSHSPYEVISTNDLSYNDIITLKGVEDLLEKYYNSGRFKKSLSFIIKEYFDSPFEFYLSLYEYFYKKGLVDRSLRQVYLYTILYNYISDNFRITTRFNEFLKYDYFINVGSPALKCVKTFNHCKIKSMISSFVRDDDNIEKYMPELSSLSIRERFKHISFEVFDIDIKGDLSKKQTILFLIKKKESKDGNRIVSFNMKDFPNSNLK